MCIFYSYMYMFVCVYVCATVFHWWMTKCLLLYILVLSLVSDILIDYVYQIKSNQSLLFIIIQSIKLFVFSFLEATFKIKSIGKILSLSPSHIPSPSHQPQLLPQTCTCAHICNVQNTLVTACTRMPYTPHGLKPIKILHLKLKAVGIKDFL